MDVSDSEGSEKSRSDRHAGVTVLDQDEERVPAEEEIIEYAEYLGIDLEKEQDLLWIAREGVVAPVPAPWKACTENGDDVFYFNFETGESIWDHPSDERYRQLLLDKRKEKAAASSSKTASSDQVDQTGDKSKTSCSTPATDSAKQEKVGDSRKLEKDPNSSVSVSYGEESFSASASLSVSETASAGRAGNPSPGTADEVSLKSHATTAVAKAAGSMPSAGVGLAGVGLGGASLGGPVSQKKESSDAVKKGEASLEEIEEEEGLEAADESTSQSTPMTQPELGKGVKLLEDLEERVPAEEEVVEYAHFLGIDLEKEQDLLWIAREGVVAPVPAPWKACTENGDDVFYFNFETGESIWDHPSDERYRQLLLDKRKEKAAASSSKTASSDQVDQTGDKSKTSCSTPATDSAKQEKVGDSRKLEKDPNSSVSVSYGEESFSASASLSVSETASAGRAGNPSPGTADEVSLKSHATTAVAKAAGSMPSAGVGLAGVGLGGASLGGPVSQKKESSDAVKKGEASLEEIEEEEGLEAADESTSQSAPMTKPEPKGGLGIAGSSASELSEDFMSEGSPNSSFVGASARRHSIGDTLELSMSASMSATGDLDLPQSHPLEAEVASLARSLAMLQKIRESQQQYLELVLRRDLKANTSEG